LRLAEQTAVVEALIFASEKPLTLGQIAELIDLPVSRAGEVVDRVRRNFDEISGHGMFLAEVAGGFQFRTRPEMAFWIKKLQKTRPLRLSTAALEILAIVAYRQPLTRAAIEQIRGVDCGGTLRHLLEKKLIRVAGKKESPGRPLLYATTDGFLEVFGLRNLEELPDPRQIDQLFSTG
jgi:segregation and condensation protein B